jgi:hypothetical protein
MTMQWAVRPQPLDSRASANQGSGFLPSQLPGLMFWVDSRYGITLNGGTVSSWADQSGNGNSFVQATSANQPAYTASDPQYNGKPSLTFVAANQNYMDMLNAVPITVQPMTVYIVGHMTSDTTSTGFFDQAPGASGRMLAATGVGTYGLALYAGVTLGPAGSVAAPSVVGCVFNGASSSLLIDASQVPIITGNAGSSGMNLFEIGAVSGAEAMNGKMCAFLIYNGAHTAAQIQQNFLFLGNVFGIAVS